MKKKHSAHNWLRPCVTMFFTFLFVTLTLQSGATDGKKAVIGFKHTSLQEVLEKVEKVFEVQFTYDPAVIKSSDRLDLPKKERSLDEVLQLLSRQFSLKFLMVGNLIGVQKTMAINAIQSEKAADITIKGTVKDKNDQPLAGATVKVKGGSKAVVTNSDGSFSITVPKGSVLEITSVGYESQEIKVQSDSNIGIVLQPGERSLTEVVVTALGVRKEKAKVAYATQEVKGEALQKAPESNIASNLVGKVAGLSIYTKSSLFDNPDIFYGVKKRW